MASSFRGTAERGRGFPTSSPNLIRRIFSMLIGGEYIKGGRPTIVYFDDSFWLFCWDGSLNVAARCRRGRSTVLMCCAGLPSPAS